MGRDSLKRVGSLHNTHCHTNLTVLPARDYRRYWRTAVTTPYTVPVLMVLLQLRTAILVICLVDLENCRRTQQSNFRNISKAYPIRRSLH